jgi:hypothetical protein
MGVPASEGCDATLKRRPNSPAAVRTLNQHLGAAARQRAV